MNNTCVLLDLSPILYRSHYGRDQSHSKQIAYRSIRYIMDLISKYDCKYFGVALDSEDRNKLKRKQVYPEYKSNRKKERPIEIIEQLPIILEFLDSMNIKYVKHDASEADDVLFSISKLFSDNKIKNLTATGDKDLIQIKNKYASIAKITRDGVKVLTKNDFPVDPKYFTTYQSIVGDKIDSVPGVKGLGHVAGKELVDKYGTLENIYSNLDKLKPRYAKLLEEQKKEAFLSRWLCRLHHKVPVGTIASYEYDFDYTKALDFLESHNLENKLYNSLSKISFDF